MTEKKKFLRGIGIISFIYLLVLLCMSDFRSLWMDDVAQIQISLQPSFMEMIRENIKVDCNPPLSHLMSYVWIRLVPYGCGWLKSMNIILVSAGIYICGIIAYEMKGKLAGIATICLAVANRGIISLAAYTFRPYGMLFFLSAVVLLLYLRCRNDYETKTKIKRNRNAVWLCLAMLLAAYTHYFSILVIGCLFLIDLILVLRKRISIAGLLVYSVVAVGFLPWLFLILRESLVRIQTFWPSKPNMKMLYRTLLELEGYDAAYLFLSGVLFFAFLVGTIYFGCVQKRDREFLYMMVALVPVIVIAGTYLVSKYSSYITSLFVARYFICICPFLCVVTGCMAGVAASHILERAKENKKKIVHFLLFCMGLLLMVRTGYRTWVGERKQWQPFCETAEFLRQQEDVGESNVVVFNTCYDLQKGWNYYLTHKGKSDEIEVCWYNLSEEKLQGVDKAYVVVLNCDFRQEDADILNQEGFRLAEEVKALPIQIYQKE